VRASDVLVNLVKGLEGISNGGDIELGKLGVLEQRNVHRYMYAEGDGDGGEQADRESQGSENETGGPPALHLERQHER